MKLYFKDGRRYHEAEDQLIIAEGLQRLSDRGMTDITSQVVRRLILMANPTMQKENDESSVQGS